MNIPNQESAHPVLWLQLLDAMKSLEGCGVAVGFRV
jgi:hypothetical protein